MMQTDGDTRWRWVDGSTQIRIEHDLNQQQDFDLGHKLNKADSKTESCKGNGTDGYRIWNKYGIGLWDKSKNTWTKSKMRTWQYT